MSESGLLERYSSLWEEADQALRTDPSYIIEIAERSSEQARRAGRRFAPLEPSDV